MPPGRRVAGGGRRAADRRRQPRRGPGAAVDRRSPCSTRGRPGSLGGRDELSGGTWLAVNEHGVCAGLTNQPLGDAKDPSKRSRGELPLALARHATAADGGRRRSCRRVPTRRTTTARWLLVGDRTSLFFVDFTGSGDGIGGRAAARDPRAGEPGARRALAQGRPGAGGARRPRRRATTVVERLPPRPGRPPDPRGRRAAERGQLRAPRGVRDPVVVPRAGGRRRPRRPACGWPTGRRAPRPTTDVSALWTRRAARGRRLSRGRAACSGGGAAGRRRRRGACAGRPRSR